jgi:hypothetical protein
MPGFLRRLTEVERCVRNDREKCRIHSDQFCTTVSVWKRFTHVDEFGLPSFAGSVISQVPEGCILSSKDASNLSPNSGDSSYRRVSLYVATGDGVPCSIDSGCDGLYSASHNPFLKQATWFSGMFSLSSVIDVIRNPTLHQTPTKDHTHASE